MNIGFTTKVFLLALAGSLAFFGAAQAAPTVSTGAATNINATYATGNGSLDDLDGETIVEHGFVWSVDPVPVLGPVAPVAQWKMNDNAANTSVAESIRGLNGTSVQNTSLTSTIGRINTALSFGGSDYIIIPATSTLDLQQLSISAWVYSANFNQQGFVFEKTTNGAVNTQYSFFFHDNSNIYFRTHNTVGAEHDLNINWTGYINNGQWNYLVATYDGVKKKIFINGIERGTVDYNQTLQTNPAGTSIIGAYGTGGAYRFNGKIDDVRVYNYRLGEGDIGFLYSNGLGTEERGGASVSSYTSLGAKNDTGSFSASLDGLFPNLTYYYRSYATNNTRDTTYANIQNFTSSSTDYAIWTGASSTSWFNGNNWSTGIVPTTTLVIINGNYLNAPTLDLASGTVTIKALSLGATSTSVLTISNGSTSTNKLIVNNDVFIGTNGTLTHAANTTAQSHVINLEAERLTIFSGGRIDANYRGYQYSSGPGAGEGGSCCSGYGGGGHGGTGGTSSHAGGTSYDSVSQPVSLGSGGGGDSVNPGSGGGAIKLSISGTTTVNGVITADGQNYRVADRTPGGGSGGSIWLSTGALTGNGTISAIGGNGQGGGSGGGGGRIAVYYATDNSSVAFRAYGGTGWSFGGAGTVYKKAASESYGNLIVDNNNQDPLDDRYIGNTPINEAVTLNTVTIQNYGNLNIQPAANVTYSTLNWSTRGALTDAGGIFPLISDGESLQIATTSRFFEYFARNYSNLEINGYMVSVATSIVDGDITVNSAGVVTHPYNTTTQLYAINLMAANLNIESGGKIDASFRGYQGASGPGSVAITGNGGGNGGAAHGGSGGSGAIAAGGAAYGSVLQPATIGSGGGQSNYGSDHLAGSGGGAVKLVITGTTTINGSISVAGQTSVNGDNPGGGSGGSLWLTTGTLAGTGTISANGGNGTAASGGGGGGRITVYYTNDTSSIAYQAYGGTGWGFGGAGIIYKKASAETYGDLIIDNNSKDPIDDRYIGNTPINETVSFNSVSIQNYGNLNIKPAANITYSTLNWSTKGALTDNGGIFPLYSSNSSLEISTTSRFFEYNARSYSGWVINGFVSANATTSISGDVLIGPVGVLTHQYNTTTEQYKLKIVTNNLTISSGGKIDASYRGYKSAYGPGSLPDSGSGGGNGGAGSGGSGGSGAVGVGGVAYGSMLQPTNLGSGGGQSWYFWYAGSGGGAVKLVITGTTTVNGSITVAGQTSTNGDNPGGGSGGSLWLTTGTLTGTGTISAIGGNGTAASGGGGGGRIAIYYTADTSSISYQAYGGTGWGFGGAGTIYRKASTEAYGDLIVDNNGKDSIDDRYIGNTPINEAVAYNSVSIQNYGNLNIKPAANITYSTLNWSTNGALTDNGGIFPLFSNNSQLEISTSSRFFEYSTRNYGAWVINGFMSANATASVSGDILIGPAGVLTHQYNTTTEQYKLKIIAANLIISSGGKIDASYRGYKSAYGPGSLPDSGSGGGNGGAGSGGAGGRGAVGVGGVAYGSMLQPINLGSGGGQSWYYWYAGSGGGAVKLTIAGTTTVNGSINVAGQTSTNGDNPGGGSGGSLWLTTGTLGGTGTISAIGGNGTSASGGGSGGRIAVYYNTNNSNLTVTAAGGTGWRKGNSGTIVFNSQFISQIDPGQGSGYDYASLSAWESAVNADLTLSSNKVYSHSGKIGTINDNATVTGSTTAKKAEVIHAGASQIFLKNIRTPLAGTLTMANGSNAVVGVSTVFTTAIADGEYIWNETDKLWVQVLTITDNTHLTLASNYAGTGGSGLVGAVRSGGFSSGERVKVDASNYVTITDNGYQAAAVAVCKTTTGAADTNPVTLDGWNTSPLNYIKIWTDPSSSGRHTGKWDTGKYRLEVASGIPLTINEENVTVTGLQISSGDETAIYASSTAATSTFYLSDNIIKGNGSGPMRGIYLDGAIASSTALVWNNIIYDYDGAGSAALSWNDSDWNIYAYNNTVYNTAIGFDRGADAMQSLKNNLVYSANAFNGSFTDSDILNDYNAISENTNDAAVGGHGSYNQVIRFVDAANKDFHLKANDNSARNKGTLLSTDGWDIPVAGIGRDIDNQTRPAKAAIWDIGADESVVQVINMSKGVNLKGVVNVK